MSSVPASARDSLWHTLSQRFHRWQNCIDEGTEEPVCVDMRRIQAKNITGGDTTNQNTRYLCFNRVLSQRSLGLHSCSRPSAHPCSSATHKSICTGTSPMFRLSDNLSPSPIEHTVGGLCCGLKLRFEVRYIPFNPLS